MSAAVTPSAEPKPSATEHGETQADTRTVAAAMLASRALVAVAARSMGDLGDITVPQYRALVVLSQRGKQPCAALAVALDTKPSTLTRLADRLAAKGLIDRQADSDDRRQIIVSLTSAGRALVARVNKRRWYELTKLVGRVAPSQRATVVRGLELLADAAGEIDDAEWVIPWD